MLLDELKQTRDALQDIADRSKDGLGGAPEGRLRISCTQGAARFYRTIPGEGAAGSYLTVRNGDLAAQLAQKEYNEKVLDLAEQQLRALDNLLGNSRWGFEQHSIRKIFADMHPVKQRLVTPYDPPDDLFVEQWQNAKHPQSTLPEAAPRYVTEHGEHVRSKSEALIASALARCGIPYHYEVPLQLSVGRTLCPDFTVLNVRTREVFYWEHFGMLDDGSYLLKTLDKLDLYEASGIYPGKQLIVTRESRERPLGTTSIDRAISAYLL